MDIEEFIANTKKPLWIRRLRKGNFQFNIWDLIELTQTDVYASRGSINRPDWKVHSSSCLKCGTLFEVRITLGEFYANTTCQCESKTNNWNVDRLECYFDKSRATQLFQEVVSAKTRKFKGKKQFWIDEGFTETDAIAAVAKWQKEQSDKSPASKKGAKTSTRCVESYLSKGMTLEEASVALKEVQTTNGLSWYIRRYGEEEGKTKFEERITKWLTSYYSRDDIIQINKSKGRTRNDRIAVVGEEQYLETTRARIEKMVKTKVEKGMMICPSRKDEKTLYMEQVAKYTSYSLASYYELINPLNLKIGADKHHVDHIFSRHHGFLNGIAPEIIGSPSNLRVIPWKENLSKGPASHITVEELKVLYEKDKSEHGYPY